MSDLEDPQPRQIIGERGDGTYRLTLDGEEKIRVDVADVDQENRFVARGRNPAGTLDRKVAAAEPGGPLYLAERETTDEAWERRGEVTFAEDL